MLKNQHYKYKFTHLQDVQKVKMKLTFLIHVLFLIHFKFHLFFNSSSKTKLCFITQYAATLIGGHCLLISCLYNEHSKDRIYCTLILYIIYYINRYVCEIFIFQSLNFYYSFCKLFLFVLAIHYFLIVHYIILIMLLFFYLAQLHHH